MDIYAIILVGGAGTRLSSLFPDTPKALVPIGNKVFLDIFTDYLSSFGIKKYIFCVGYKKEQIISYIESQKNNYYDFKFSEEEKPLGTGGALKNTELLIDSDTFIVMNGDSICLNINLRKIYDFHIDKNALVTIATGKPYDDYNDYGNVILDSDNRIISFNEKSYIKNGKINAGIYIMDKKIFEYMSNIGDVFSLEHDIFPKLCNARFNRFDIFYRFYGFITDSQIIDIGTPERYRKALDIFKSLDKK